MTRRIGPPIERKKKVSQAEAPTASSASWRDVQARGKGLLSRSEPAPEDADRRARAREQEPLNRGREVT